MTLTATRTTSHEPTHLLELTGIGPQLAARIARHINTGYKEWQKYGTNDHLYTKLQNQPDLYAEDEEQGQLTDEQVMTVVARDPYHLRYVRGIGFKRADAIAKNDYGIHPDDERRHEAGNQAALEQRGALPIWDFRKERKRLELTNPDHELLGVTIDHDLVWLPAELRAEQDLATLFQDVLTAAQTTTLTDPGIDLGPVNDDQLLAVKTATSGTRLMALTGGAGTGKTFVTAAIAKVAKATGKSMRVMAFAGKAANRSQEAMREAGVNWVECSTIHRALHLKHQHDLPDRITSDIVILDEASMIPNWLMAKVVNAMKPTATLVLVGDPNQLPPIGFGTPFQDYLALGLPHVHLTQNYRQAGQVSIHEFAEAIRTQDPGSWKGAEAGVGTYFGIDTTAAENDFNESIRSAAARLDILDWQVVTWKNETRHLLNQHLQELLNQPKTPLFTYRLWELKDQFGRSLDAVVTVGDKVLVTDNDYEIGVFNGQTGVIVSASGGQLDVDLGPGEGVKTMPINDARDLMQLGYCVTVHKAQGSGWDTLILYQPEPVKFSPRRFYYTSVTRAKHLVEFYTTLTQRAFWQNACQADHDPDSTLVQRVEEAR